MTKAEAKPHIKKLAAIIADCHRHHLCVGDFGPNNVMSDERMDPVIMDLDGELQFTEEGQG
ncbi:MAG: hypothetical protein G8345_15655 [Magnetococcales bacterium]|nr:hypothetical protein [Magnetococcales bacterium]NGZ28314.1 hypothetical protein [Magnetococcales bacterium]